MNEYQFEEWVSLALILVMAGVALTVFLYG